jgi:hypothetical protein
MDGDGIGTIPSLDDLRRHVAASVVAEGADAHQVAVDACALLPLSLRPSSQQRGTS